MITEFDMIDFQVWIRTALPFSWGGHSLWVSYLPKTFLNLDHEFTQYSYSEQFVYAALRKH